MNSIYVSYGSRISKSNRNFNFASNETFAENDDGDVLYPEIDSSLPDQYSNDNSFPDYVDQVPSDHINFTSGLTRNHLIDKNKPHMFSFPPVVSPHSGSAGRNSRLTAVYKGGR
jgi:hypothetical protein